MQANVGVIGLGAGSLAAFLVRAATWPGSSCSASLISACRAGDSVKIKIKRGKDTLELTAVLGAAPLALRHRCDDLFS